MSLRGVRYGPWWAPPTAIAMVAFTWEAAFSRHFSADDPWGSAVVVGALVLLGGLVVSAEGRRVPGGAVPLDQALLWCGFALLMIGFVATLGPRVWDWDVLLLTGILALLLGVELADRVPGRMDRVITRLIDREVILITAEQRAEFDQRLARRSDLWMSIGGSVASLTLLAAWVVFFAGYSRRGQVLDAWFAVFECLLGWFAGRRLGRMTAHSSFWKTLCEAGAKIQVVPGHVDGAAGFGPLGAFFLFSSMIAGIPAAYLAGWWWLFPLWPEYKSWRLPYLGMLPIAIGVEVLAFVLPMIAVHVLMRRRKAEMLRQADQISRRISSIRERLTDSTSDPDRQVARNQIEDLTEQFWNIERLPTWPIDSGVRRRFGLGNLPLFLPFLGYLVDGTTVWQQITGVFGGLTS